MPQGDKYVDFTRYLENCGKDEITLTVEQISNIAGGLPNWVYNPNRRPWSMSRKPAGSLSVGWINAGYVVSRTDAPTQLVTFVKIK